MIASFLITLREGLEAALIIGVVLSYLGKVGAQNLQSHVWRGVLAAILASGVTAGILFTAGIQLEGRAEMIFEGVALLAAAGMLTWVIFWMNGKDRAKQIKSQTATALSKDKIIGLFFTAFFAVVREGIELALLLLATQISTGNSQIFSGALLGLVTALFLGWVIFKSAAKLDLGQFFRVTNILLLLFAAGLVGYGVHELNEAGVILPIIKEVWNINHILNDKSEIGLFMKALFGYNGNPSLTEIIAYAGYILMVVILLQKSHFKQEAS